MHHPNAVISKSLSRPSPADNPELMIAGGFDQSAGTQSGTKGRAQDVRPKWGEDCGVVRSPAC